MEHIEDFQLMSDSASPKQITAWTKVAEEADRRRLGDVTAMDIYNIALPKGVSEAVPILLMSTWILVILQRIFQARLMELELNSDREIGITASLVSGLKLQEYQ